VSFIIDVGVVRRLHRDALVEFVEPLYLPLPDSEDVSGVLPVLAYCQALWLAGLDGVGCEEHAELLDELVRAALGADACVYLGVAHLDDACDLGVREGGVHDEPHVGSGAVWHLCHLNEY